MNFRVYFLSHLTGKKYLNAAMVPIHLFVSKDSFS